MRFLFDANLSPKLVFSLADLFPGSVHVFETGLAQFTADEVIWEYAQTNGSAIVTADSDFVALAGQRGAPPKVIRLDNCNYKTARVEQLLRQNAVRIAEFDHSA